VYEETYNSVLTTLSKVTEAATEPTEVNSFAPEIEVEETFEAESRILNKEIEQGTTYKDVHSIDYIINSYLLAVKNPHSILSRSLFMEKF